MDTFYQVFGFVAAICIGIIVLSAFFTVVGYFKSKTRGFDVMKLKGFVKDGKLINVYLSGGKSVLGVRFVGFSDQSVGKGGVPYQLSGIMVLETTKDSRVLIRADSVRMIEEVRMPANARLALSGTRQRTKHERAETRGASHGSYGFQRIEVK